MASGRVSMAGPFSESGVRPSLPCLYSFSELCVKPSRDAGLLGFTTKHIYFLGHKKKFRVHYDRIVDFEPFDDGIGIMKDNQTAKPQAFRTGDGWFSYNLAVNLAQM